MFEIIGYILLAVVGAFVLFLIGALTARFIYLRRQEILTVEAVISDMHTTDMSVIKSVSLNSDRNSNVIEFDIGGVKLDFLVSKWVYGSLEIGMKGLLTYKDTVFIGFDPFEGDKT